MSINAGGWHKETGEIKQHVDQTKHLYVSASISKIMSKGTDGLEGTAYVGRVFKNLGDVLHVKFARLFHRFFEGEWVDNKTVRKDLNKKIKELTDLVKGPKLKHLSKDDKALVEQGIAEMQEVCAILKERGIKGIDSISKKLSRALPGKVSIPEGLEEQIVSQKSINVNKRELPKTSEIPKKIEEEKKIKEPETLKVDTLEVTGTVEIPISGKLSAETRREIRDFSDLLKGFVQTAREKGDLTESLGLVRGRASNDNTRLDELLETECHKLSIEEFKKNADEIIGLVFKGLGQNIFIRAVRNREKLKSIRHDENFEKTWKKLESKYDKFFGPGAFNHLKVSTATLLGLQ